MVFPKQHEYKRRQLQVLYLKPPWSNIDFLSGKFLLIMKRCISQNFKMLDLFEVVWCAETEVAKYANLSQWIKVTIEEADWDWEMRSDPSFYSYRVTLYSTNILLTIRLSPWSLASMLSTDVGYFGKLIWSMQNIIISSLLNPSSNEVIGIWAKRGTNFKPWWKKQFQSIKCLYPVHSFVSPVHDKIQTSRAGLAKLRKITLIHQYIDFYVVEEHNYMK